MLPLVVALFVALALTTWFQRARGFGVTAQANPDVVTHDRTIPLLGGVAIMTGLLGGLGVYGFDPRSQVHYLVALGLLVGLGLFKDLRQRDFSPAVQLLVQTIAVSVLVFDDPQPSLPSSAGQVLLGVLFINGLNFIDVMDGLASTVTIVCAGSIATALVVLGIGDPTPALVLIAATMGFLWFNRPKATIFMGDVGSFGIALTLLWLLRPAWNHPDVSGPLIAVVLAAPLLEVLVTGLSRVRRGRSPWVGDELHPSLRLLAHGLRPLVVIAIYAAVTALAGLVAVGASVAIAQ
ncbi:MAG: undecaprenyl/decaprenyl-phosphate alpha-N-acetylglucosaminyl 1-phosphate transferase [Deltaproteobacteria bacterium]|nr:undecaprenyl/decaprenyl-phosphate alpha-N-acetylglucosaminyl 1-phosphate transferase [Deltaproteobacteria bacterium]